MNISVLIGIVIFLIVMIVVVTIIIVKKSKKSSSGTPTLVPVTTSTGGPDTAAVGGPDTAAVGGPDTAAVGTGDVTAVGSDETTVSTGDGNQTVSKGGNDRKDNWNDPSSMSACYTSIKLDNIPKYDPTTSPTGDTVSSIGDVPSGKTVVVANGTYSMKSFKVDGTMRAQETGKVIIKGGTGTVTVRGVMDGIVFDGCAPANTGVVEPDGGRVTRCTIKGTKEGGGGGRKRSMQVIGGPSLIDNCEFLNHDTESLTAEAKVGVGAIFYRCLFKGATQRAEREILRCGSSQQASEKGLMYCDECLILDNGGERNENLSYKCSSLYLRGTTFKGNVGNVSNRYGSNSFYEFNTIVDNDSGGMRIFGDGHQIIGNVVKGNSNWDISFGRGRKCGSFGDSTDCEYQAVYDITFEDNDVGTLDFGSTGKDSPECPKVSVSSSNNVGKTEGECKKRSSVRSTPQKYRASSCGKLMSKATELKESDVGPF